MYHFCDHFIDEIDKHPPLMLPPDLNSSQILEFHAMREELEKMAPEIRDRQINEFEQENPVVARLLRESFEQLSSLAELPTGFACGKCKIIRKLNEGGWGVIYLATQDIGQRSRDVALKLVHPNKFKPQFLAQFEQEIQNLVELSEMRESGIVQIFDAGRVKVHPTGDAVPYFVMELVKGERLDTYCSGLPTPECIEVLIKICEAIQAAHKQRILHLDLKPANILVTANGQPVILDFGLAQHLDPFSALRTLAGTLPYMAPEQIEPELGSVGGKTDVYALGVILFELLTGEWPYACPRESETAIIEAITTGKRRRLHEVDGTAPVSLERVLDQALALRPAERMKNPAEFGRLLREWLNGPHRQNIVVDLRAISEHIKSDTGRLDRISGRRLFLLAQPERKVGQQQQGPHADPLQSLIESTPRLFVHGSPGAGKSVALERLIWAYAEKLSGLPDATSRCRIPVYIRLGLAPKSAEFHDLIRLILKQLCLDSVEPSFTTLQAVLQRHDLLLLLDGLNEIDPEEMQRVWLGHICDLLQQCGAAVHEKALYVTITSRTLNAQDRDKDLKETFLKAKLLPPSGEEIIKEIGHSLGLSSADAAHFLKEVEAVHTSFRYFIEIPQHLDYFLDYCRDHPGSAASTLAQRLGSLGRLLQYCMDKRLKREFDSVTVQTVQTYLQKLADLRRDGGVNFPAEDVESVGIDEKYLKALCSAGILVPGDEGYRFFHHSVQQYFLAKHLRTQRERWGEYAQQKHLWEPLSLMAGFLESAELQNFFDSIGNNLRLKAYMLSCVYLPEQQNSFLAKVVEDFKARIEHAGRTLFGFLVKTLGAWILLLVLLPVAMYEPMWATFRPALLPVMIALSIALLAFGPKAIRYWYKNKSAKKLGDLREIDLPDLLAVNQLLPREGVMQLLSNELTMMLGERAWQFGLDDEDESDPRIEFLASIRDAVDGSIEISRFTLDQKLAHLDDMWMAHSIPIAELEMHHIELLCGIGCNKETPCERAIRAVDVLCRAYVERSDLREKIRDALQKIAKNPELTSERRQHGQEHCHELRIPLDLGPTRFGWVIEWLRSLLRFTKRILPLA